MQLGKTWVDFALSHDDAMTPFGKAYAAQALWQMGENARAEALLDRALDGSREDPDIGVYWAPEKISWLWYNDTIEKHAFFLRTLLERRPDDKRIRGMIRWLLVNRKGNEWKSSKASAAAVYSLLEVLKARGALESTERFQVSWPGNEEKMVVHSDDWLAKPLRRESVGDEALVSHQGAGLAFASLTSVFSTEKLPEADVGSSWVSLKREFFTRAEGDDGQYQLKPLGSETSVRVGEELEVHLTIDAKTAFEYAQLKDARAAGTEAEALTSGWRWDELGRYEEPRDSLTNFFMSFVPRGEYVLRYRLRATTPGVYRVGPAVLQSMYAPEISAYTSGFVLQIVTGDGD